MAQAFDTVIVGTGFASSFFLQRFLQQAPADARILVLEAGERKSHHEQLAEGMPSSREILDRVDRLVVNRTPEKIWAFTVGLGGSSNCWWGNTPRMMPADFRLRTRYGVGVDWPIDYEALEPFYCDAEEIMGIAGPSGATPTPRSRPYPQPPHRMTEPDRLLAAAWDGQFFPLATARASRPTSRRSRCCAASVCRLCPRNAKFTILNELAWLYDDPRVDLRLAAPAARLDVEGGRVTGVVFREREQEQRVRADLVVLGANALFNAHLLLSSGLSDGGAGRGLVEQVSRTVSVFLDGVDNFQGGTSHTGHGFMFYDGEHRRTHAAALVETSNTPQLRQERGKWRQFLSVKFICEDLRQDHNAVSIAADTPRKPEITFTGHDEYAHRGLAAVEANARKLLAPLPVERIEVSAPSRGEAHILGTTVMGADPRTSVVDADCVHHRCRNLLVLGSGTFPTAAPANPTLTVAAVALRAAARLDARSES